YFLPDGQHFLYFSASAQGSGGGIYAGSLNSGESVRVANAQSNGIYAEPGYVLYHREGTLYAQPFDAKKLAVSGEPTRIADKLPYAPSGAAAFSASHTGILIFRRNPESPVATSSGTAPSSTVATVPLVWNERSGKKLDQLAAIGGWVGLSLS